MQPEQIASSLSGPLAPKNYELVDVLASTCASTMISAYLDVHASLLTSEQALAMRRIAQNLTGYRDSMKTSLGKLWRFLPERSPDTIRDLTSRFLLENFDALPETQSTLFFQGRSPVRIFDSFLALAGEYSIHKTADGTACIRSLLGDTVLALGNGIVESDSIVPRFDAVRDQHIPSIFFDSTERDSLTSSSFGLPIEIENLSRAPSLYSEFKRIAFPNAEHYFKWIEHVAGLLIFLPSSDEDSFSGSWSDAPSVLYLSLPGSAIELGDVLIHESSHQYFHLLDHMFDLTYPGAPEYFSPSVGRNRPLSRILIAYHAFANVLIYYDDAYEGKAHDDVWCRNVPRYANWVSTLTRILENNASLTEVGASLWSPVHSELDRRGLIV